VENPDKICVLVIDNNALNKFALKTALKAKKEVSKIVVSDSVEKGINLAAELKPDIVIIGFEMPGVELISTIELLKSIDKNIKVIVLSTNQEENEILDILCAGAQAYCLKDTTPEKLWQIIDFIRDGALWFDNKVAPFIINTLAHRRSSRKSRLNTTERKNETNGKVQLTHRELDVLGLIVDGYTNPEISKKLCVSIHTAKAHVANILHKLSVDDRTQAAIKALKDRII
jgi:DNA-binding NarL/FixJ family response regulator